MIQRLTASNIVRVIDHLSKAQDYNYIHSGSPGLIRIREVTSPEGPIRITRWNPNTGETASSNGEDTISTEMIWRIANAFQPNQPINFDRVLGGSYNTRSVLEALLAHTPQFYYCYPGRIETMNSAPQIRHGHKHLIWMPDNPHQEGRLVKADVDVVISEVATQQVIYDALHLPDRHDMSQTSDAELRRHAQIQ